MTDKLTEIAMAICDSRTYSGRFGQLSEYRQNRWRRTAKAALEAMREPTDEMGKASALVYSCKCGRRITQWGTNAWQDMLAALEVKDD